MAEAIERTDGERSVRTGRTAVGRNEPNVDERGSTDDPLTRPFEEQFYDDEGVLHDPRAGQGHGAWRQRATSDIQPPDASFAAMTGITPEQGVPQPGPALDAMHDVGGVDDEGYARRQREIERPAVIAAEAAEAAATVRAGSLAREREEAIIGQSIKEPKAAKE